MSEKKISQLTKVQGYLKPGLKKKVLAEVANTGTTESKIVAEGVKLFFEQKEKTNSLSGNHYP